MKKINPGNLLISTPNILSDYYFKRSIVLITEVNDKIVDDPSIVNTDPLGEGWFFKMKLNNPSELDKLLDKEEYDKLTS